MKQLDPDIFDEFYQTIQALSYYLYSHSEKGKINQMRVEHLLKEIVTLWREIVADEQKDES